MKTLIFLLYVVSILTMSAFARAEVTMPYTKVDQRDVASQVPAKVTDVFADRETMNLQIAGYLPDPCYPKPSVSIEQDVKNPGVLVIRLTSPLHNSVCPARTSDFTTEVNLPTLAQSSELVLENKAVYLVRIDGSEFEFSVLGSDLMKVPGFIAL